MYKKGISVIMEFRNQSKIGDIGNTVLAEIH
jgi:hypothetical protein